MTSTLELLRKGGHDDEVNARAWCLVNGHVFKYTFPEREQTESDVLYKFHIPIWFKYTEGVMPLDDIPNYTTSIDAQADLLPEGWEWGVDYDKTGYEALFYKDPTDDTEIQSIRYPNMASAMLDAILQVLEMEDE